MIVFAELNEYEIYLHRYESDDYVAAENYFFHNLEWKYAERNEKASPHHYFKFSVDQLSSKEINSRKIFVGLTRPNFTPDLQRQETIQCL